jgi:hypothetical protein
MSARIETAPAPTPLRWGTIALVIVIIAGVAVLLRGVTSEPPSAVPSGAGTSSIPRDSLMPGLVATGGVTHPRPYQPIAEIFPEASTVAPVESGLVQTAGATHPRYDPGAPSLTLSETEAPIPAGGFVLRLVTTGGIDHPAPR